MRLRKLVVQPGGIVPWHSHEKRPANIYIISGSITEYRSTCAVPIEHGAGDVPSEFGPLAHWWKNNAKKPTVLRPMPLEQLGVAAVALSAQVRNQR
jgi:quercetin dioxygenase-like cupin family protein